MRMISWDSFVMSSAVCFYYCSEVINVAKDFIWVILCIISIGKLFALDVACCSIVCNRQVYNIQGQLMWYSNSRSASAVYAVEREISKC